MNFVMRFFELAGVFDSYENGDGWMVVNGVDGGYGEDGVDGE